MLGRALGAACAAAFVLTGCGPDRDIVEASGELEAALAESERLGLPLTAAQLSGAAPSDHENAAAGLLEPLARWAEDRSSALASTRPETPRPAEAAAIDDPMLNLAAKLAARPRWHIPRAYGFGPHLEMPEMEQLRQLISAWSWRASDRAKMGDDEGALADLLSMRRLARHLAQEPHLNGGMHTLGADTIAGQAALAMGEAWKDNPTMLRRLAQVLADTRFEIDFLRVLRGEFYFLANALRNEHHSLAHEDPDGEGKPSRHLLNDTEIPSDNAQRAGFTRFLQSWNRVLGAQVKSLSGLMARIKKEEQHLESMNRPSDYGNRVFWSVMPGARTAIARQQVMQDMRRATVLAAAFRAERGRWPKDLAEIGVEIKNPLSGDPVGYAAQGARITLWTPEPGTEDKGAVFESKPGEKPDTWRIIWPAPKRG